MLAHVWRETRARWQRETARSVNRGIAGAAVTTAAVSLVPRVFGFLKEATVAAMFGLSGELEAYLVALALVGIPLAVLLNPLQSVLIPALVGTSLEESAERGARLMRGAVSMTCLGLGMCLLALPMVPDAIGFIAGGWPVEKQTRVASLVYGLIPYYFLSAVNLLGYGALQARRRFFENAFFPATIPVATIAVLLASGQASGWALVAGVSLGVAVEWVCLNAVLWRGERLTLLPGRLGGERPFWLMFRQFSVLLPGTLAMAFMPVVDQTFASRIGEGAVAALAFGNRIPSAIAGLLVTAIGQAVLPFASQLAAAGDHAGIRHMLRRWTVLMVFAGLSVALTLILVSPWLVDVVFRRGAFHQEAATLVTKVQRAYLLQLPGMLAGMLVSRTLLGMGAAAALTIVTIGTVAFWVGATWILSGWFGVSGIALSAALTSSINAVVLSAIVYRRLQGGESGRFL